MSGSRVGASTMAVAATSRAVASSSRIASSSRCISSSSARAAITTSEDQDRQKALDTVYKHSIKEWKFKQEYPTLPDPPPIPKTHGILVATMTFSAHYLDNLDTFARFSYLSARSLNMPTTRPIGLPWSKELITVLRGPFVHKKFQENFERRTHRRVMRIYDTSPETLDLWLRYIKKNSLGGIGLSAKVHEWVDYGFGRKEIEGLEAQFDGVTEGDEGIAELEKRAQAMIRKFAAEDNVKLKETPKKDTTAAQTQGESSQSTQASSTTADVDAVESVEGKSRAETEAAISDAVPTESNAETPSEVQTSPEASAAPASSEPDSSSSAEELVAQAADTPDAAAEQSSSSSDSTSPAEAVQQSADTPKVAEEKIDNATSSASTTAEETISATSTSSPTPEKAVEATADTPDVALEKPKRKTTKAKASKESTGETEVKEKKTRTKKAKKAEEGVELEADTPKKATSAKKTTTKKTKKAEDVSEK